MRTKTSDIWQYFRPINNDFAKCKICGNNYSRKGRTTTSLRAHLKAMHKDIYEENANAEQSQNVTLERPSSVQNATPLQRAEKQLSLAESWHKEKYEELCKIQEQVEVTKEQSWSDSCTKTLQQTYRQQFLDDSVHDETHNKQLCQIEIKNEYVDSEQPNVEKCLVTSQENINISFEDPLDNNQTLETSHSKAKEMDDAIGEMIVLQNLSFHFVEGIGFRRVVKTALPDYQLRGHQFFTNYVLNEIYCRVEFKVKVLLSKCLKLSFTIDIWSEPSANVSLFILTAHGLSEDLTRVKIVLRCCLLQEQTSDKICKNLKKMLRDWGISDEHVHCFVRDGSSMAKTIHLAGIPDLNCPVRQLQLCVRSALETPVLMSIMAKCREICSYFKDSEMAQDELVKIQANHKQPILHVIQDCDDRWNSALLMINRLLDIKQAISFYAIKNYTPQISPEEWSLLKRITVILSPLQETIVSLSDPKTSISSVIPLIYTLKHILLAEKDNADTNQVLREVIENLIEDISIIFGDLTTNTLYTLATYLDPRYKLKLFDDIIKEQVQSKLLCLLAQQDAETARETTDVDESQPPAAKKSRIAIPFINEPHTSFQSSQSVCLNLANVLNSSDDEETEDNNMENKKYIQWKILMTEYSKEKRVHVIEDPLLWWKYNTKYKDLTAIVGSYLSPPASSVNDELYNEEGLRNLIKNRLNNNTIEKLSFVKYNLPLINFDY